MRSWSRIASGIATGVVLILFGVYAMKNREVFSELLRVSWTTLMLVAVGRLFISYSNGLFIKWTTEAFSGRMTTGEGVYVEILSAVGNFFGPLLAGAGLRAVYLRRVHNLPYTKFTSTLMVYYVILFGINFALAIVGLLTLPFDETSYPLIVLFAGGLIFLCASVFIRLPKRIRADNPHRSKVIGRVIRYMIDIEEGWHRLLTKPWLLAKLVALSAFFVAAQLLIAFVSFDAVEVDISWASLVVYVAIVTISLLVAITPGALGIREAMLFLVAETLGVRTNEILQVAVIDRGVTFAVLLALFMVTRSTRLRLRLTSRDTQR